MSNASDFLEFALGAHIFGQTAYDQPQLFVALFSTNPGDANGGNEFSGGSYARVNFPRGNTRWLPSSQVSGAWSNKLSITFAAPTANWGVASHFGLFDSSGSNNLLVHGALTTPKTINNGDAAPTFPTDTLVVTIA